MKTLALTVLSALVLSVAEAQVPPDISYNQDPKPKQSQESTPLPTGEVDTRKAGAGEGTPALSDEAKEKALEKHYKPAALRKQLGDAVKAYVVERSSAGVFSIADASGNPLNLKLLRVEKHSISQEGDTYTVLADFKSADTPSVRALVAFTATGSGQITGAEVRSTQDINKPKQ